MLRTAKTSLIAVAMTASMLAFTGPADAAANFSNCGAMHRTFKNGVAKSRPAAHRQERAGLKRPDVRPDVYRANKRLDADHDGTACEARERRG